ncbi:DUF1592 domain-containing protein [Marinagarivorans algicola]|uniref:DUF1592 domain-containing protein n=1 Tax=Marinagarivorans algicola TaxID=1513270 RepID=UPI0006B4F035|nr:DUF1592 domain-containing protein [Marinagarivorans algicola]
MRKIVPLALVSAVLAACSGTDEEGSSSSVDVIASSSIASVSSVPISSTPVSSTPAPVSSSSQVTTSSTPVSSTPVSSMPTSSASNSSVPPVGGSTPLYASFAADALKGADLFSAHNCNACHGTSNNEDGAINPLNVNKYTSQSLFAKVHEEMPLQIAEPTTCVDQCAADITAYLETWRPATVTCSNPDTIGYTPRRLRLLTVDEYQNSLEDLLGLDTNYTDKIVGDGKKGKFPNNATTVVGENRANKYWAAAESIAAWAVENDKPFSCNGGCADKFIDEFAPMMYRRPLTDAERAIYEKIFDNATGSDGLQFSLVTALNSPQFLYRSELGHKVSEVLATEPVPYYRPAPPLTQWNIGTPDADGFTEIRYYAGSQTTYNWTGNDIVAFTVKATKGANGELPTQVKFTIGGKEFEEEITTDKPKTYRYKLEGLSSNASKNVQINNQLPNNSKFYVSGFTFGKLELYTPARGDEEKMKKADPDSYVLDPYEYATLLAYTLTGSTPDKALFDAANNDGLHYEAQIRAQVERLLDSPRGRERMGAFAGYWFETDKVTDSGANRDATEFPNYTMAVRESMAEEVRELFREIFYNNREFNSLYSGDFTVLNKTLADYYGVVSGSTGADDWQVVDSLEKRGGILTTGAFMTVNAHPDKTAPIIRAVRMREQMLCQHIAPPPLLVADRDALLALADEEYKKGIATTRRYYEVITDSPACAGCHEYQINPLFGTEDFDQVGQWRDTQKGSTGMDLDIDNTGTLYGATTVTDNSGAIEFNGAKGLSKVIAQLPGVEECLMDKTFRFVAGMPIKETSVDANFESSLTAQQRTDFKCVEDKATTAYNAASKNPRAVMTEMVMQDLLRYRKAQ